jgi:hypothetical protein
MDLVRMGQFRVYYKKIKKSHGQSAVEYILLLAVSSVLVFSVLNNARFKNFMKGDSGFFAVLRTYMESTYRYPYFSKTDRHSYHLPHDSYNGRFWGPKSKTR